MVEVFQKVKPEYESQTDCHIGVCRKIIVDLEGVRDGTEPCKTPTQVLWRLGKDQVGDDCHIVCNQDFFCKPYHKTHDPGRNIVKVFSSRRDLSGDGPVADDRSCNQLREQTDIEPYPEGILLHGAVLRIVIYIHNIAHRLKGKKGDSDR